ncbi:hypothetical protein [Microvirga sesbaniae]|uniref:hypothetical protein n=1 Tax=Microvirga sesbaniae TaxID=681392 RepID=UPI0021C64BDB|nr:hypothetical protein [Microvirga sp. HBU67692]
MDLATLRMIPAAGADFTARGTATLGLVERGGVAQDHDSHDGTVELTPEARSVPHVHCLPGIGLSLSGFFMSAGDCAT